MRTKYIIWMDIRGGAESTEEAFEDDQWNDNKKFKSLKKYKLIWNILFSKGFLWRLQETIKYALLHSECYRGTNACDVMEFTMYKGFYELWDTKEEKK